MRAARSSCRRRGGIERDPAVEAAAVALLAGHDPLPGPFLTLDEDDLVIAQAVLNRAHKLRAEELSSIVKGHAELVAVHVARNVARLLKR